MASNKSQRRERATYLSLIGLFLGLFAAVVAWTRGKGGPRILGGLDLALIGLSAYRAGRLVAPSSEADTGPAS